MTWNIIIQMPGDDPSEAEVEEVEQQLQDILDANDFGYMDLRAQ